MWWPLIQDGYGSKKSLRRHGFLLLWANAAILILLLLAGSVLGLAAMTARQIDQSISAADRLFLAQDAMETMKYNLRFHGMVPVLSKAERNGRSYRISATTGPASAGGLPMRKLTVEVTDERGEKTRLETLAGKGDS